MDSLHLCIAVLPMAIYMLWLAATNLRSRPTVVGGFKDNLYLALAVSGFAIVGPLELFLPESAAFSFGPIVWVILLVLYLLVTALVVLSMRPRVVVYNLSAEELRPVLADTAQRIDPQVRWAGESLDLPGVEVHLHLDRLPTMRNVQLVSSGPHQDFAGWVELEKELRESLKEVHTTVNPHGMSFLLFGALLIAFVVVATVFNHSAMVQSLQEMLRM